MEEEYNDKNEAALDAMYDVYLNNVTDAALDKAAEILYLDPATLSVGSKKMVNIYKEALYLIRKESGSDVADDCRDLIKEIIIERTNNNA